MPLQLEEKLSKDIEKIRDKVVEMGELAEKAVADSTQAIREDDHQLAYSVILRDSYIDELEKNLDRLCQEFIVRQQPVAGHLRFVYAAIKITNELERVGDYGESIARQFLELSSLDLDISFEKFYDIAEFSIPMLRNSVQAFAKRDADLAQSTRALEKNVDNLRYEIHNDLMKAKLPPEASTPLMIIANRYERVADQACNICEEVLYMCTGENIKHEGKPEFRVLFVDEHDSCRGPIAEGIARSMNLDDFVFNSAGISPAPANKTAVGFMQDKGIDITGSTSKYLHEVLDLERYSVIVALCKAGEKAFPAPPTKTVSIRWDVPDLSNLKGSEQEVNEAFEKTYEYLERNIRDLVNAIRGNDRNTKEEKK